jgi:acetyltransferase-like isoleucine patch superfamily enzyme
MTGNSIKTGQIGNSKISIGRFSYGTEGMTINQWNEGSSLQIGSFCSIAGKVTVLLGGNHRLDWISTYPFGYQFERELGEKSVDGHPSTNGDVVIGNDVWVGQGATIMSGITIGDGAVISANAHVVKNVMPYEIVGGNPAKLIKKRFSDEIINLLLELKWWDLSVDQIIEMKSSLSTQPTSQLLIELIEKYRKFI